MIFGRAACAVITSACLLIAGPAQAGCIHVGRLWTCTVVGGPVEQMMCVGSSAVRACQEFSRPGWLFIGRHEVLSQVLADADLSDQLQRSAAAGSGQVSGGERPTVLGALGAGASLGSSTPPGNHTLPTALALQRAPPSSSVTSTVSPIDVRNGPLNLPSSQVPTPLTPALHEATRDLTNDTVKRPTH